MSPKIPEDAIKKFSNGNHGILELERLEAIVSNTLFFLKAYRGPVTGPRPQRI